MTSIQQLIFLGGDLGYQGEALQRFVSSGQERQWDEREQSRRERGGKEEAEREKQVAERAAE